MLWPCNFQAPFFALLTGLFFCRYVGRELVSGCCAATWDNNQVRVAREPLGRIPSLTPTGVVTQKRTNWLLLRWFAFVPWVSEHQGNANIYFPITLSVVATVSSVVHLSLKCWCAFLRINSLPGISKLLTVKLRRIFLRIVKCSNPVVPWGCFSA